MSIEVYGIPNCDTCQKALKWLVANDIDHDFINMKQHPPGREAIENWVKSLTAKALRNTSGRSYRELGDEKQNWTDDEWIDAFAKDAMLIKRPVIVKDGKAVLAGFRATDRELREKLGV
ncbi:Spx/MgsR family RNA polymerase-binding regulatory protein [Pannus brasiliensis CCIBt3594]|uniref:Spx/MgsR family RNA polymerase-binding regulatory protein n=1 Tax=Pannus brasiliensis CCIBt3594 TaxID=1427578 RepID=A0AAW9QXI0_9CHRO